MLEGTLRDFSASDLYGLIGTQAKTGVLTVESGQDSIAIFFLAGQIVLAESAARSLDDRVGDLLAGSGKLAPERLRAAKVEQKKTHESLAVVLARQKAVAREDLAQALRLQISRISLSAVGWTEGEFKFREDRPVDHDPSLFDPIPAEAIRKESVRRMKEWPKLAARVSSPDLVFRRTLGLEKLRLVDSAEQAGPGALLVSRREAETWALVDGNRRVKEIQDRAFLSDLDLYNGLSELLDRSLIAPDRIAPAAAPPPRTARISAGAIGLWAVLLLVLASAVRQIPKNPLNLLLRPVGERPEARELFKAVSLARLASVERAVRIYYDSSGGYPKSLQDLLDSGVLTPEGATDPYGRPYRYILRPEDRTFRIYGRDAMGDIDLDLSFERSLAPVVESRPDSSRQTDRQPGVHVVR